MKRIATILTAFIMIWVVFAGSVYNSGVYEVYAASSDAPVLTATAKVKPAEGAFIRSEASVKSSKVGGLKSGTKVVVQGQIFTSLKSTAAKEKWYLVTCGDKTGYMRSDVLTGFKYKTVKAKTIKKAAYRYGAGGSMKKKGTIKKNKTVKVVLAVTAKNTKTIWYKIKVGSKYYFISGKYLRFSSTAPTLPTESAETTTQPLTGLDIPINYGDASADEVVIKTENVSFPERLGTGMSFGLSGKVTSNVNMEKVLFGVVDSNGKWVLSSEKNVNANTFNIATIDKDITFGKLSLGDYTYKGVVYVGGKGYTAVSYDFVVVKPTGADKIASTAIALAWPKGTAAAKYKYSGGSATSAFKAALNEVFPNRSNWGAAPKVGASCDVFVGTAVRKSGYDKDMPRGLGNTTSGQWAHLAKSNKWQAVPYSYKESDLKNGDIIIYQRYSGSEHICIYVKINGQGYLAEAAIKTYYGHLTKLTSGSKIFKKSDKKKLIVYRPTS